LNAPSAVQWDTYLEIAGMKNSREIETHTLESVPLKEWKSSATLNLFFENGNVI